MSDNALRIGWAQGDITPTEPVFLAGQFYSRISEGVRDPIGCTALSLAGADGELAVLVSCDLVSIPDPLREGVHQRLRETAPEIDPATVLISATHTHTAPVTRPDQDQDMAMLAQDLGIELPAMRAAIYNAFAADRIAETIVRSHHDLRSGAIAFGLGQAVTGRNRRWMDHDGAATMYGDTSTPRFDHIEGYEDHGLNLIATYDGDGRLTGLLVNLACPSQVSENEFRISADYWCELRAALRARHGEELFVLGQCSAAGDQSPHLIVNKRAEERMLGLAGRDRRAEIAERIAAGIDAVLPLMRRDLRQQVTLRRRRATLSLCKRVLGDDDAAHASAGMEQVEQDYRRQVAELRAHPERLDEPRWYRDVSVCVNRARWFRGVVDRHRSQETSPTIDVEVLVLRLGDLVFASNPFELYLDFGLQIKARSPATQTFLVQLAGRGSYLPSARAVAGGGYGAVPASTPVGPEGGRELVERTLALIAELWQADAPVLGAR